MQTQDFEQFALDSRARWGASPFRARSKSRGAAISSASIATPATTGPTSANSRPTRSPTSSTNWPKPDACAFSSPAASHSFDRLPHHLAPRLREGYPLTLFTNATLATDEIAQFLKDYPPAFCEVTLYGASAEDLWPRNRAPRSLRPRRRRHPPPPRRAALCRRQDHCCFAKTWTSTRPWRASATNWASSTISTTDVFPRLDRDPRAHGTRRRHRDGRRYRDALAPAPNDVEQPGKPDDQAPEGPAPTGRQDRGLPRRANGPSTSAPTATCASAPCCANRRYRSATRRSATPGRAPCHTGSRSSAPTLVLASNAPI